MNINQYSPMIKPGFIEGKMDWRGKPARRNKHGGFWVSLPISVAFGLEALVATALASNLVTYFNGVMHFNSADAANHLTTYLGINFSVTILLAVIADAYLGRFLMIIISATVLFTGVTSLGVQAHFPHLKPPPCNHYNPDTHCAAVHGPKATLLLASLYMVAVGSGGVKATLPSHGADQFDDGDKTEARQMSSYFNWLLLTVSVGNLISVTVVVWLQDTKGWDWGFGMCALTMLIAIIVLAAGVPFYRNHVPNRSNIVTEIMQVLVAAISNRKLQLPEDSRELYEINNDGEEAELIPHTNSFKFLDKAAVETSLTPGHSPSPWKQCTVTQVETLKILLNMLPIFVCSTAMTLCLAQLQTFTVEQATTMDLTVTKNFKMQPGSLPVIPFVALVIITPIYDRVFVPFMRKLTGIPTGITYLQRVGVGIFLAVASMTAAAIVESTRKHVAVKYDMIDATPMKNPLPISVFWLSFQSLIMGIADLFSFVGLLEFFYSQVPNSIKSVSSCFLWMSNGLGYFLSSILVTVVNWVTKSGSKNGGWLAGDNLNRARLDLFYWLLAILTSVDFFLYLYLAKRYKYRQESTQDSNDGENNHSEAQ